MSFTELERVGFRAPLTLRCTDQVTGRAVGDGLRAEAVRDGASAPVLTARRSPFSALLGFGTLPETARLQRARSVGGAPLTWEQPGEPVPYAVTVHDRWGRYLPVAVRTGVPRDTPVDVPLFSAVTRPTPSGWATVRGETRRAGTRAPAPWCVVEVSAGGSSYRTISDPAGRYTLVLPYPDALPPLDGEPTTPAWPITVGVRCEPGRLTAPAHSDVPYLDTVLGQAPAPITDGGDEPAPLTFGVVNVLPLTVVPA